jgi:hypothetical protein
MMLHYNAISPLLKEILLTISQNPLFKDFVLVGGTCLSLQIGHRRSIDIDMFTDMDYPTMDIKAIKQFLKKEFPFNENLDSLDNSALGYSLRIGLSKFDSIKLDLFYTEKFIFPIIEIDNIHLADLKEIAAMKIAAISHDLPRQKDFWDIHELLNLFTLKDMIKWSIQRNPYTVTEKDIISGFSKLDKIIESPEGIDCFKGEYWELIKEDLKECIEKYNS